jgi:hypothetical protein
MLSAGYTHAIIATRLMGWLLSAGIPADRIAQAVGLRIPGKAGVAPAGRWRVSGSPRSRLAETQ